ncbi:MAG: ABC transporter ATP-binding protein [Nostocoides sp.]|uniref:ABC transporter ATP-binding protein n=1 Tax=Nostocoides sp. TaxID=1917966 RepID=UPI003BCC8D6D
MAEPERRPALIVSHVDITYRVKASKKMSLAEDGDDDSIVAGLFRRGRELSSQQSVVAVQDVSFVAYHGESIGIIGRNGSGKSTLLRAAAGLIPPTAGEIYCDGDPSLLGVNAVLMSRLTGERNVYIGGQAMGLTRAQVRDRFGEIVEFSGIGQSIYRPMKTYSSGQAARLRFAISAAAAPDILMIDEALATGDADFKERSAAKVAEIREQASTVFLVSHSNATIRQLCTRVLWMDRGRLVADGPTDEVVAAYERTLPKKTPPAKPPRKPAGPPPGPA